MKFNQDELVRVACAVVKHNPHNKKTVQELVAFMESLAYQELHTGQGYIGTSGFFLMPFRSKLDPNGEIHIKAGIDACVLDL
jgi:hypothetical protein